MESLGRARRGSGLGIDDLDLKSIKTEGEKRKPEGEKDGLLKLPSSLAELVTQEEEIIEEDFLERPTGAQSPALPGSGRPPALREHKGPMGDRDTEDHDIESQRPVDRQRSPSLWSSISHKDKAHLGHFYRTAVLVGSGCAYGGKIGVAIGGPVGGVTGSIVGLTAGAVLSAAEVRLHGDDPPKPPVLATTVSAGIPLALLAKGGDPVFSCALHVGMEVGTTLMAKLHECDRQRDQVPADPTSGQPPTGPSSV